MRETSQHSAKLIAKAIKKTDVNDFARGVRSAVYGLWSGRISHFDFIDSMTLAIESSYRRAWREGAKECGVEWNELTLAELDVLRSEIWKDTNYIFGFADSIEAESKANGGKLGKQHKRAELWVNRYKAVYNQAQTMACADKKMVWRLGATEKHCTDCSRLDGKVKRASTWRAANLQPQSPRLECRGFRCDCRLEITDLPLSRGPLPAI